MGVSNHAFPLALINPALRYVDPYDPNITPELASMVWLECQMNPWYFLREVFRVPPQASKSPLKLKANRANIGMFWLLFNHITVMLIQPRQTGKSINGDAINTTSMNVTAENSDIQLFTKDDPTRIKNIARLKQMREYLPLYISNLCSKDTDNKTGLTNTFLNNTYKSAVAQNSIINADKVARGLTAPINHVDEVPYCKFIYETLPTMLSSANAARDEARLNGSPYYNLFTTTAGERSTKEGEYAYNLLMGGMTFDERKLFDRIDRKELEMIVERGSKRDQQILVSMVFSHRQLGYTDEWLYGKMRETGSFGDKADKDYFNVWLMSGAKSPIPKEISRKIADSVIDPNYIHIDRNMYTMNWYIPESEINDYMSRNKTIIGMDTSDAVGRDSITMVVMDVKTLGIVATLAINETNIAQFAKFVADFMVKFPTTTLIPERKSSGMAIIDAIVIYLVSAGICPFRRIYSVVVDDKLYDTDRDLNFLRSNRVARSIDFYSKYKKHFGYNTAGSGIHSRSNLYKDTLQRAVRYGCDNVRDKTLSMEINGLVAKNGRIDHSSGNHDDMVISWLLAMWMVMSSKNLSYYGIDNAMESAVLYEPGKKDIVKKPSDVYVDLRAKRYRDQINTLITSLSSVDDELARHSIENRIRSLDKRYPSKDMSQTNLDSLINDAKKSRIRPH